MVILGDMFELGEYATKEHQHIADLCVELGFEQIVLCGKAFSQIKKTSSTVVLIETTAQAKDWLSLQDIAGKQILLKGSRGMKMETLLSQS